MNMSCNCIVISMTVENSKSVMRENSDHVHSNLGMNDSVGLSTINHTVIIIITCI